MVALGALHRLFGRFGDGAVDREDHIAHLRGRGRAGASRWGHPGASGNSRAAIKRLVEGNQLELATASQVVATRSAVLRSSRWQFTSSLPQPAGGFVGASTEAT